MSDYLVGSHFILIPFMYEDENCMSTFTVVCVCAYIYLCRLGLALRSAPWNGRRQCQRLSPTRRRGTKDWYLQMQISQLKKRVVYSNGNFISSVVHDLPFADMFIIYSMNMDGFTIAYLQIIVHNTSTFPNLFSTFCFVSSKFRPPNLFVIMYSDSLLENVRIYSKFIESCFWTK